MPEWLESIDLARGQADLLTGVFTVDGQTSFERLVAVTHYPDPAELGRANALVRLSHRLFGRRFDASLAGGRSMAFTKTTWRSVGGFPEDVYTGEDQAFSLALVREGWRAMLLPEATVAWRPPPTWGANATMLFRYCRGDIRSRGRSRHLVRALAWNAAPLLLMRGRKGARVLLLVLAAAYTALPVHRAWRSGTPIAEWWRIPLLIALKDMAQIAGAATGIADALRGRPQPNPHGDPMESALTSDTGHSYRRS